MALRLASQRNATLYTDAKGEGVALVFRVRRCLVWQLLLRPMACGQL
jgi:hypothetical protein